MPKKATAAATAKTAPKAARPAAKATQATKATSPAAKATKAKATKQTEAAAKATKATAPGPTAKAAATKAPPAKARASTTTTKAVPAKAAVTGAATRSPATPAKEGSKTVVTKKAEATAVKKAAPKAKVKGERAAFFAKQRELLLEERQTYISSAEALKAQADSLALEHEPGDVQFDEEGGEGGTANVDREIDLYLSAQARATVVEIDRALQKIDDGTYGICEQCGDPIPEARLQALPFAALCVSCKSGGLSSRR